MIRDDIVHELSWISDLCNSLRFRINLMNDIWAQLSINLPSEEIDWFIDEYYRYEIIEKHEKWKILRPDIFADIKKLSVDKSEKQLFKEYIRKLIYLSYVWNIDSTTSSKIQSRYHKLIDRIEQDIDKWVKRMVDFNGFTIDKFVVRIFREGLINYKSFFNQEVVSNWWLPFKDLFDLISQMDVIKKYNHKDIKIKKVMSFIWLCWYQQFMLN